MWCGVLRRPVAAGLVLFLALPLAEAAGAQQQQSPASPQTQPAPFTQSQAPALETRDQNTPQTSSQTQSGSQPVGTAAAPLERPTGVTFAPCGSHCSRQAAPGADDSHPRGRDCGSGSRRWSGHRVVQIEFRAAKLILRAKHYLKETRLWEWTRSKRRTVPTL